MGTKTCCQAVNDDEIDLSKLDLRERKLILYQRQALLNDNDTPQES